MRAIAFCCIAAAALLTACATPEQRAASHLSDVDQLVAEYGPACDKLGYARNSDPWRNCLLQLSTKDDLARYNNNVYFGARSRWYW
ncbi:hypothetical protein E4K72_13300 [Oxalobacteraceae bacterium OM1]|nr:hypothetical protein E4K72_13300 [Oxalobacteraceae bacterium OM1]